MKGNINKKRFLENFIVGIGDEYYRYYLVPTSNDIGGRQAVEGRRRSIDFNGHRVAVPKVTRSREYRRKAHTGTPIGPPVDRLSSLKVIPRWCASSSTRGPKAKPLERQEWGLMAILNRGVYKPGVRCHTAKPFTDLPLCK